ncbi:MAG: hypothetical protein QOH05_595 [Acetobacteraceae bacterium]|jgi:hypothetical protein|nr:hypothetical protein [Acetobacteraceae bacterium]
MKNMNCLRLGLIGAARGFPSDPGAAKLPRLGTMHSPELIRHMRTRYRMTLFAGRAPIAVKVGASNRCSEGC